MANYIDRANYIDSITISDQTYDISPKSIYVNKTTSTTSGDFFPVLSPALSAAGDTVSNNICDTIKVTPATGLLTVSSLSVTGSANLTDVKLYDDKLEGSLSKYLIEFKTNSSYSLKLNSYNLHLQSQSSLDLTTTLSQGTISIGDGTTSTIFLGGQKIELTADNIDLEYGNYGTGSEGLNVNLSKISINFTGSVIFNQRNNGALTLNSDFFVWCGWNIYFLKPDEVKTFSTSTGTITPSNLWMGLYTISQSGNSYFTGSINYARTIGGPALCFYSTFLSI